MTIEPVLSTRPVFLQIKDILALRIAEGQWTGGAPIPSEQDLASQFKVSVATIRKSLAELEDDGMVTRQQGRGTFVTDRLSEPYKAKYDRIRRPDGSRIDWRHLESKVTQAVASSLEASQLGVGAGAEIYHVQRVIRGDRRIFMRERAIYPAMLFPDLDKDNSGASGIVSLTYAYKIILGRFVQTLRNVPSDKSFAALAGVETGATVWELTRTTRDHDGRIIEYRECLVTPEGCVYWHNLE